MPSVSIVIPTFNRAGLLGRCIDSALAQTYACEVLVCDHGSTDATPSVVRGYGSRVRYVRREFDSGIHFAWLDGVISATGELVHINYDDDLIRPTYIEKCMALMGPQVAFCFTVAEVHDLKTGATLQRLFEEMGTTGLLPATRFLQFQLNSLVSPGATLIRRSDIIDNLLVGRVPYARYEYRGVGPDWLLTAMTTLRYPKVGFVSEPLAIFTAHAGSITTDAEADSARLEALSRAYEEARRYFFLARLIKTFRLNSLAGLWLAFYRIRQVLWRRIMRVSRLNLLPPK